MAPLLTTITKKLQVNKSGENTPTLHIIVVGLVVISETKIYLLKILCRGMCYEQLMNQQIKSLMTINKNQTHLLYKVYGVMSYL